MAETVGRDPKGRGGEMMIAFIILGLIAIAAGSILIAAVLWVSRDTGSPMHWMHTTF